MPRTPTNVTTSSSLEGWSIDAHLGVVASHVVAGTGMFSDFAAGFSDLFGGRSGTYQNQLSSLYQEAIAGLYLKAERLGGNWIVGLSVDIDEISGKGMQMFMVTAIGTAVRATRNRITAGAVAQISGGATAEEVTTAVRRRQLEQRAIAGTIFFDEETWNFVIQHGMVEVSPAVMRWIARQWKLTSGVVEKPEWERYLAFFRSLPADLASQTLYGALAAGEDGAEPGMKMIRDLGLMDLSHVAELLREGQALARRYAVQTLAADQANYCAGDLEHFDEVITLLQTAFPASPHVVETRGMLGGRKEKWACSVCGEAGNSMEASRCGACHRDVQGFYERELTPAAATRMLTEKRDALVELLAAGHTA
jgi:uncharacterized protein YbjQ (UPF0145 family)